MNNQEDGGQATLGFTGEEMQRTYYSTLEHIEKIVEYHQALEISDLLFEKADGFISVLAERLKITDMQAVLFALLFSNYNDCEMTHSDLTRLFKCSPIRLLNYLNDIDELKKKDLIQIHDSRHNEPVYRVPRDVVNSLRKQDYYEKDDRKNLSCDEFFDVLDGMLNMVRHNPFDDAEYLESNDLYDKIMEMINNNKQLEFCRKITDLGLPKDHFFVLILFCHLFVNNSDDEIGFHDIRPICNSSSHFRHIRQEFKSRKSPLFRLELVENTNNDGYMNGESFKLSDKAKRGLLSELNLGALLHRNRKNLMLCEKIPEKKLFFSDKTQAKIDKLHSLLKQENFTSIQERMKQSEMRSGFACLFYGGPGTGKTETVYQLARETGRDIMTVDISSIKSKWVGETEKQIKEVFDNYRHIAENSDIVPILFFNEADAVIGRRIEFSGSSRAVDRMENTMQNIILQELENLKGILIATTNLTANFDRAFERRFLYKIEFDKPTPNIRSRIWRNMIPSLSEKDAEILSGRFDFSGGQIENIARKRTVDVILEGVEPTLESLIASCSEETMSKDADPTIGFTV